MQTETVIPFKSILKAVEILPQNKLILLRNKIEKITLTNKKHTPNSKLLQLLLNAPTLSSKEVEQIKNARKEINIWRAKAL